MTDSTYDLAWECIDATIEVNGAASTVSCSGDGTYGGDYALTEVGNYKYDSGDGTYDEYLVLSLPTTFVNGNDFTVVFQSNVGGDDTFWSSDGASDSDKLTTSFGMAYDIEGDSEYVLNSAIYQPIYTALSAFMEATGSDQLGNYETWWQDVALPYLSQDAVYETVVMATVALDVVWVFFTTTGLNSIAVAASMGKEVFKDIPLPVVGSLYVFLDWVIEHTRAS